MAIQCARCGRTADPLSTPPVPGATGAEIQQRVCGECWQAWLAMQVILINEHRLALVDPRARTLLAAEMRVFLGLDRATAT